MFDKWKTLLALVLIYMAVLFEWNWVWGVLFLFWTVPALYSGRTHLVEEVDRKTNPALFWLIIGTWLTLSLYLIAADIFSL